MRLITGMHWCQVCQKEQGTQQCLRCHNALYCSEACQKNDLPRHRCSCFEIKRELFENANNRILHEAHRMNLFSECRRLEMNRKKGTLRDGSYDLACYFLYKGVVSMILFEPIDGIPKEKEKESVRWLSITKDIFNSYQLMKQLECGNMWNLDSTHWSYIPKGLCHELQLICNMH